MSEVKRFGVILARGVGELRECPSRNGEYVKYEDYAALKAERDALAAENAMLKGGPQGFFAYGSDVGYEEFDTAEKAAEFAENEISDYRGYACDGWSDEVGSVVWGVIMQRATMTGLRPVTEEDGCDPAFKQWCDYTLLPEIKTPATDAAIAEWKAQGAEACVDALVKSDDPDFNNAPHICAMVARYLRKGVSDGR